MNESKALTIIDQARKDGALIFSPQNLDCPPLYKAEATIIKARPDEFHNMKGKYMPNRAVTDRISEAAGVDFIAEQCRVVAESRDAMPEFDLPRRTVFVGYAQGRQLLPDGSWRRSTVSEYEFDPMLRAVKEGKSAKSREALEYSTFARQRASTGARLGVIRQLVGIPVTFSQDEIVKPLVFSRIVQNTDYILGTSEGKMMAIAMATGAAQMLYGGREQIQEKQEAPYIEDVTEDPPMRDANEPRDTPASLAAEAMDDAFKLEPEPVESMSPEVTGLINTLTDYIATNMLPKEGSKLIQESLDSGERRPEELRKLVDRAKTAYDTVMARRKAAAGKTA